VTGNPPAPSSASSNLKITVHFQRMSRSPISRRSVLGLFAAMPIASSPALANVAPPRSEIRDSIAKHFAGVGTSGTFVGYKVEDYLIIASDTVRSGEARLPASTFKVANALIALETGVVEDPDQETLRWDGVTRANPAWNRDHSLRSAMAASVVPVFQELARRIGPERMQKYVDALEYGNRDIGGGIDQFWLTGKLRIDPIGQIDFLDQLRRRSLTVSKRAQDIVCDIMPVTKTDKAVIHAKSGLVAAQNEQKPLGWMVGWVERDPGPTVFAMNMDCPEPTHVEARMAVTEACLADIEAL